MKISRLRTLWITFLSYFITGICLVRIVFTHPNRTKMNQMLRHWSDKMLKLGGISYRVINPNNYCPKEGTPTIMMVNHTSAYDIPLSFKVFPEHAIRMLAKKELSRIPLMGQGIIRSECLFVDRKNRHQAVKDLINVRKLLETGIVMWIAPEGTRSHDGKLAPLKKGGFITAIIAKATIIPVGIRGAYEILPKDAKTLNYGQETELHVGEPIDASQYTLENRDELIERVYQSMLDLTALTPGPSP